MSESGGGRLRQRQRRRWYSGVIGAQRAQAGTCSRCGIVGNRSSALSVMRRRESRANRRPARDPLSRGLPGSSRPAGQAPRGDRPAHPGIANPGISPCCGPCGHRDSATPCPRCRRAGAMIPSSHSAISRTASAGEGLRKNRIVRVLDRDARSRRAFLRPYAFSGSSRQRTSGRAISVLSNANESESKSAPRAVPKLHGQHGIDAESELQRGLHHQQIRARGHARHDAHLGVRKTLLELLQDVSASARRTFCSASGCRSRCPETPTTNSARF